VEEVLPDVYHWTARHPRIGIEVSSYWLDGEGVAIDPLLPAREGLQWFAQRPAPPRAVLLSNRHHYRGSRLLAERFGCEVYCPSSGLHEFGDGEAVRGFEPGERLPGGVLACEVDAICPDETALHVTAAGALAIADGIVRGGPYGGEGPLGFVPDGLMDDPPATKRGLLAAYGRLLAQLDFQHLLLAHGGPVIGNGRELLAELVESGGRTAFEL
jgi:hypothetical protein